MKVAVALILDEKQRVLITQRPAHASHGGFWEFPGGKLEAGELPSEALIREIKEEVGLDILDHSFLGSITHNYDTKTVDLLVFSVEKYRGDAYCRESQSDLRWVLVNELENYHFPEANKQIIELVQSRHSELEHRA
ncbi:MAG: 8-oxo-dGTP diphosphatase MutT [Tatlockia sp.]|nr:8-oxo-dGTP diphosphatase MutT [Tatlockia sp.]